MPEKPKPKVTHSTVKKYQRRSRGSGWGWIAIPLVGAIGLLVLAIWAGNRGAGSPALDAVEKFADQGNAHLSALTQKHDPYNSDPPTSGPHMENLVRWGYYDQPQPPEYLVHNLEDGGVVVYYKPSVPDAVKDRLKTLQQVRADRIVVVPGSADQKDEVTLTAWTVLLRQAQYDDEAARAFAGRYAGTDHHKAGQG